MLKNPTPKQGRNSRSPVKGAKESSRSLRSAGTQPPENDPRKAESRIRKTMAAEILKAATNELIEKGYAQFSVRGVAAAAGMRLSSLQYHFKSFDELLAATLKCLFDSYLESAEAIVRQPSPRSKEPLTNLIRYSLQQVKSPRMILATTESWALAHRNAMAREVMQAGYEGYLSVFMAAITPLNPRLSEHN